MKSNFTETNKSLKFLILPIKNPSEELFKIINYFHKKLNIIVIDDGSKINTHFFKGINKKVLLIRNKKNMGKGFSIKKAFRLILLKKNVSGAIIADSDGQHAINILKKFINFFPRTLKNLLLVKENSNF